MSCTAAGAIMVGNKHQSHKEEKQQNSGKNKKRQVSQTRCHLSLVETIGNVEAMVFKRGLSVLPESGTEEQVLKSCNEGRIISNDVFPLMRNSCGGCGEVNIVDGNDECGMRLSLCFFT